MPGASGSSDTSNSPNAAKLKALCESVETLKAERQAIEAEIKGTNPDMKNVFLTTHGQEGAINEEEMSKETLNRAFSGLIHQVLFTLPTNNIHWVLGFFPRVPWVPPPSPFEEMKIKVV